MSFEKISSDECPCAVGKGAVVGLFRVVVELMSISVFHVSTCVVELHKIKSYKCSALE